jgi:hypothetical protein
MRISEFIRRDMEHILVEWEDFARTLFPPSEQASQVMLRDHAREMLQVIAKDLARPQSTQAQIDKSQGLAVKARGAPETAAETHAILRARSGFNIDQLVAEYRALRATVLRLWLDAAQLDSTAVADVIRFNEAIDQAIAESIAFFTAQVEPGFGTHLPAPYPWHRARTRSRRRPRTRPVHRAGNRHRTRRGRWRAVRGRRDRLHRHPFLAGRHEPSRKATPGGALVRLQRAIPQGVAKVRDSYVAGCSTATRAWA